jgi:diphthamide synthase (EF-2-diphthine--ammonia ligase)
MGTAHRRASREFIDRGFEAVLVCLDPSQVDPSFAGRAYDESLLADLPASVHPCGENGELHTFLNAGPSFDHPIVIERGDGDARRAYVFCDVLPVCAAARGTKRRP